MIKKLVHDKEFASVMKKNIINILAYFFENEQHFSILCKLDDIKFEPPLPQNLQEQLNPLTLFILAGYTFETAHIQDDWLIFEAGFGAENFGSIVYVPLLSIMQIIIDETPILINLSLYKEELHQTKKETQEDVKDEALQNSMQSFLNNPENAKFLKK
ncbi:FIG00469468: hypothetical protein [hydrothermal vent metagenome]|uniref:Stringent starvation protein B n=1 Tax=hydrothermal vent metagenome TaxID=652676 RepID=A0A1W1D4C9_9ZZZZ